MAKKKIKLPRDFRNKWLEMLTSGKYKQTMSVLTNGTEYCCLGVAGRAVGIRRCDLEKTGLPSNLADKHAKKYPEALVKTELDHEDYPAFIDTDFTNQLANMNDRGSTFIQIAAYIKKNTIGV